MWGRVLLIKHKTFCSPSAMWCKMLNIAHIFYPFRTSNFFHQQNWKLVKSNVLYVWCGTCWPWCSWICRCWGTSVMETLAMHGQEGKTYPVRKSMANLAVLFINVDLGQGDGIALRLFSIYTFQRSRLRILIRIWRNWLIVINSVTKWLVSKFSEMRLKGKGEKRARAWKVMALLHFIDTQRSCINHRLNRQGLQKT